MTSYAYLLSPYIISDTTMAVLSSECCHHNEDDYRESNAYDGAKPRWFNSLRKGTPMRSKRDEKKKTKKPNWNPSFKQNSPSMRSSSEGGSLSTQRKRFQIE
jgi:hypothetical protein